MKRLSPLIFVGIFAAAQQLAAQSMSRGSNAPYAPPSHPMITGHTSNQPLETANDNKSAGPTHVSISVAAEEKGSASTTFPTKTPHLYGSFTSTGTEKGDRIHAVWVQKATKKPLYKTDMVSSQANAFGTVSINAPPAGWSPGKYELDLYVGNKMVGRAPFTIKQ